MQTLWFCFILPVLCVLVGMCIGLLQRGMLIHLLRARLAELQQEIDEATGVINRQTELLRQLRRSGGPKL